MDLLYHLILPLTRLTRRAGLRRSRPWYKLKRDAGPSPGLAGKNGTFSEKSDKKGSQNRVRLDHSHSVISLFFREFPGFLKIQVEMPGAGKRGVPGAVGCGKNHEKSGQTDKQALAV